MVFIRLEVITCTLVNVNVNFGFGLLWFRIKILLSLSVHGTDFNTALMRYGCKTVSWLTVIVHDGKLDLYIISISRS